MTGNTDLGSLEIVKNLTEGLSCTRHRFAIVHHNKFRITLRILYLHRVEGFLDSKPLT